MCRYFVCDLKGKRICNLSASNRERAIKCYKFLHKKYIELNIELYTVEFWSEDSMDIINLYFDNDGKVTVKEFEEAKYIKKYILQERKIC